MEVRIALDCHVEVFGDFVIPKGCKALVIFAHGSGSSHRSPRNQFVASILQQKQIATLLIDLLTEEEDRVYENRFNINLLTDRLIRLTRYMAQRKDMKGLRIGYFGASTGAASALKAAAVLQEAIAAVVSRGGRPDLAAGALGKVQAPTRLIVGSLDPDVLKLNRKALVVLPCEKELVVIDGATHLFEEPGKLEEVSTLAVDWFSRHILS